MARVRRFDRLIACAAAVALLAATLIGAVASAPPATAADLVGTVQEYPLPGAYSLVSSIAAGPDGNVWFTESYTDNVAKITPAGGITEYPLPTSSTQVTGIVAGPDGNIWFGEYAVGKIGRISPDGATMVEFTIPTPDARPSSLAVGDDGRIWFVEGWKQKVGAITAGGVITEYAVTPTAAGPNGLAAGSDGFLYATTGSPVVHKIATDGTVTDLTVGGISLGAITAGPDGAMWITDSGSGGIFRLDEGTGAVTVPKQVLPGHVNGITAGGDGALWITDGTDNKVGRLTTAGNLSWFTVPTTTSDFLASLSPGPDGNVWFAEGGGVGKIGTAPTPVGEFTPLPPTRILDTRTSLGGHLGKLQPNTPIDVTIEGNGGVPASGVEAVVMNVTVTEPTNTSHLTVWPQGLTEPNISNLNFSPGQTIPNLVTVAINNGGVSIVTVAGQTHLVIDVVGYYADSTGDFGSRFHPLAPSRLFDTRYNIGGVGSTPMPSDHVLGFKVTGKGGVPASGVSAVVMNVTVTEQTSAGHLTVYPSDVSTPTASNLNFVPGLNTPNLVVVKVPVNGVVDFFDHLYPGNTVHFLADVVGYFDNDKSTEAGRLVTGTPGRIADTRLASPFPSPGCVPGGNGLVLNLTNAPGNESIGALVLNVTVTGPSGPGFITVHPGDVLLPNASNVNFVAGQTVPNAVIVKKGSNSRVNFADTGGCAHLVVDLFGFFTSSAAPVPVAAAAAAGIDAPPVINAADVMMEMEPA